MSKRKNKLVAATTAVALAAILVPTAAVVVQAEEQVKVPVNGYYAVDVDGTKGGSKFFTMGDLVNGDADAVADLIDLYGWENIFYVEDGEILNLGEAIAGGDFAPYTPGSVPAGEYAPIEGSSTEAPQVIDEPTPAELAEAAAVKAAAEVTTAEAAVAAATAAIPAEITKENVDAAKEAVAAAEAAVAALEAAETAAAAANVAAVEAGVAEDKLPAPADTAAVKEAAAAAVATANEAIAKAEAPEVTGLVVTTVSPINATTVQVTLDKAPTEAPTTGDFAVLVDGVAVEVSAVEKAPNTTDKFNLTVATLNGKEGSLEVNGKAAAIAGSEYGYDFKAPTVVSVDGVDKNHVKVTFSEKVDKTLAETFASYVIKEVNTTGVTFTPAAATLLADGKSVLVTYNESMVTFANGYTLELAANTIKDVKGQSNVAVKTIFSGNGEESKVAPAAVSALYDPATATKAISVKFDKKIASPDKTKIKVGGQALVLADSVAIDSTDTTGRTLKITLSAAAATAFEASADQTVAFEAGAVKDTATPANAIEASSVSVVSAAKLTTATYNEDTNKLVLNFTGAVKASDLDVSYIKVNNTALTGAKVETTGTATTVTLDLTNATSLSTIENADKTARKVEFITGAALGKNVDANGNKIALTAITATTGFTYTDDEVVPTVVSATVNATTKKLVVTFSEPVDVKDATKIAIYEEGKTIPVLILNPTDTTNIASAKDMTDTADKTGNTVVYTLATAGIDLIKAIEDKSKLTVKVAKTASNVSAVEDAANNKFSKDADASVALAYTDQDAVKQSATSQAGLASNQVKVTFDKPLAAADLVAANFKVAKSDNASITVPVTKVVGSNNNKEVILTLDDKNANYVVGYEYHVTTTAKDIYGNPVATAAYAKGTNGFELKTQTATRPVLTAAAYKDVNSNFKADQGDVITLTFDAAVELTGDVTFDELIVGKGITPGTGFKVVAGAKIEEVNVVLGANSSIDFGSKAATADAAVININDTKAVADLHIAGVNGAKVLGKGAVVDGTGAVTTASTFDTGIVLAKPDTTTPKVTKAVFNDALVDGLLGTGDTLVITFNEDISLVDGKTLNALEFALSDSKMLALKDNQVVVDGKTLTVLLEGTNTFVPGTTTIDIATANDAIADKWGNLAVAGTAVKIEKSDTVAPTFTEVKYVKGATNDTAYVAAGDKLVLELSEAVGTGSLSGKPFVVYQGVNETAFILSSDNGTDNNAVVTTSNGGKTVTITLGTNNIGTTTKTQFSNATLISTLTSFNVDATLATSLTDANGNVLAPAVGFGLEIKK